MSWANNVPILDCANRPTHKLISGGCSIEYNKERDALPLGAATRQAIKDGLILDVKSVDFIMRGKDEDQAEYGTSQKPILSDEPIKRPQDNDEKHAALPDIRTIMGQ